MMIICRAIKKLSDSSGKTIGYILQDSSGKTIDVTTDNIKRVLKSGGAVIENLKITSDGKLIYSDKMHKYDKLSYIERINKDKTKKKGVYNHSDIYDFKSPVSHHSYELEHIEYNGYIKDKKNNIYSVYAKEYEADCGRLEGGAKHFIVDIYYNEIKLRLTGYRGIMTSWRFTEIIRDLEQGYYLEDYLVKNKGAVEYKQIDIAESIIKASI